MNVESGAVGSVRVTHSKPKAAAAMVMHAAIVHGTHDRPAAVDGEDKARSSAAQRSAWRNSRAVCHRSSGFLARQVSTMRFNTGGSSGSGRDCRIAAIRLAGDDPSNGRLPAMSS